MKVYVIFIAFALINSQINDFNGISSPPIMNNDNSEVVYVPTGIPEDEYNKLLMTNSNKISPMPMNNMSQYNIENKEDPKNQEIFQKQEDDYTKYFNMINQIEYKKVVDSINKQNVEYSLTDSNMNNNSSFLKEDNTKQESNLKSRIFQNPSFKQKSESETEGNSYLNDIVNNINTINTKKKIKIKTDLENCENTCDITCERVKDLIKDKESMQLCTVKCKIACYKNALNNIMNSI